MDLNIKIPVKILTKKIPNRQDSIFYAGKNIASVKIGDATYILTTSGYYLFSLTDNGRMYEFDTGDKVPSIVKSLTDAKLKKVLTCNWGWFTVIISTEEAVGHTEEVYTTYDEALKSFIEYVTTYIQG